MRTLWIPMVGLILAATSITSVAAQERELPARSGTQWRPYLEWSLRNPSFHGNPFDLEAKAVFVHQDSGEPITTHMFYDGDGTWKFRFTAVQTGTWSFRTFSEDADLHGWSGEVSIQPNSDLRAQGFMKSLGSKWGWQGTETAFIPQYVMGKETSAYLHPDGRVNSALIDADIREFVDEHGFTGFHFAVAGKWFDAENPDLRVYRVLEELIRKVHARGGASHIWMWGSRNHPEGEGPGALAGGAMSEMDQRNLRYLAARLGPIPGWSMGYGYDTENGWASAAELNAWRSFLKQRLGWDHFLGARVGYDDRGLWAIPSHARPPRPPIDLRSNAPIGDKYTHWLGGDYIGYTSYRPLYPRYVQAMRHRPEKPSFEEDRFRLRDPAYREGMWIYKDYSEELTRQGLWHSALAGGVANIWGNLLPEPDRNGSRPYAIKDQIKTYSLFFRDRFLKEMMTDYAGPEMRLVNPAGTHLIVYREDTDRVRLDLSGMSGSMPAVAVDTKTTYREIDLGMLAPRVHTWRAPRRSDWAIAVGDFNVASGVEPTAPAEEIPIRWSRQQP